MGIENKPVSDPGDPKLRREAKEASNSARPLTTKDTKERKGKASETY